MKQPLRDTALWLVLLASTVACSGSYAFEVLATGAALDPKGSAIVTLPADGRFGQQTYAGSGATTAKAIETALAPRLARVEIADATLAPADALTRARARGVRYLFSPEILLWEDRSTAWSGKSDHLTIDLSVRDVGTDTVIHRAVIKGESSWWTLGGDRPEHLLERPIHEYVRQVFEAPPTLAPRPEARKSAPNDG